MTWDEEISEGHMGTTTHLVHLPLILFAPKILKYSKNRINFLEHSENFYFWVIFYCMENSENKLNMAFYFI